MAESDSDSDRGDEIMLDLTFMHESVVGDDGSDDDTARDDYEDRVDGAIFANDSIVVSGARCDFSLRGECAAKLFSYQRAGVEWMVQLFNTHAPGGILADDMGLGKTIMVSALLNGLFAAEAIERALIVMPLAVLLSWKNELRKWAPDLRVRTFHGTSAAARNAALRRISSRGGVLLTTYGTALTQLSALQGTEWDYLVLDEGHRIKNPARKTTAAIRALSAGHRLLLTGTPVQNNVHELWCLFDFISDGRLLGDWATFRSVYATRIEKASARDASSYDKKLGALLAGQLRDKVAPFVLRRTKAEIFGPGAAVGVSLPRKNDLVVWVQPSPSQRAVYAEYLESEAVTNAKAQRSSPLAALGMLKRIANHELLLAPATEDGPSAPPLADILAGSGKLEVLLALLEEFRATGHRALVFSQSRRMLDLIEIAVRARGLRFKRIDGTLSCTVERQSRIDAFNSDASLDAFLMTTQCCGVGITLTGADRVVIFDPAWNPAMDAQAVDRAYRIGQPRDVVVYRLICTGTVEEKVYRKQVFKSTLTRAVTEDGAHYRYFSSLELQALFVLDRTDASETMETLNSLHARQRQYSPALRAEAATLDGMPAVIGHSDHDLLFSQAADDEGDGGGGDGDCAAVAESAADWIATPTPMVRARARARRDCAAVASPMQPQQPQHSQQPRQLAEVQSPPHAASVSSSASSTPVCAARVLRLLSTPPASPAAASPAAASLAAASARSPAAGGENLDPNASADSIYFDAVDSDGRGGGVGSGYCEAHTAAMAAVGLAPGLDACSCALPAAAASEYARLRAGEQAGAERLAALLAALELADDDPALHAAALAAAARIGMCVL